MLSAYAYIVELVGICHAERPQALKQSSFSVLLTNNASWIYRNLFC
jgi:hypothetical protein